MIQLHFNKEQLKTDPPLQHSGFYSNMCETTYVKYANTYVGFSQSHTMMSREQRLITTVTTQVTRSNA